MRKILCTIALIFLGTAAIAKDYTGYVNPFLGTDFTGHCFPGAVWPFGMVQLSPDTRPDKSDWQGCSGYHYSDSVIYGFSHTHLLGTGCDDLCDVLLMPVKGYSGELDRDRYKSSFSHEKESAGPGWYEVTLDDPEVKVSLTVGRRSGWHRYTFSSDTEEPQILLDLKHRDHLLSSSVRQMSDNEIAGHRSSSSWSQSQDVYYWMQFSKPISSFKTFRDEEGALMAFAGADDNTVYVRVGISSVSEENARLNLESDAEGLSLGREGFEQMRRRASEEWNGYLSKIEVKGRRDRMRTFYSCLYQTAVHPSLYSDVNGEYRGMDRQVHSTLGEWDRYTIFSIWDTFRALHPLLSLIERERTADFLQSFQSIFDEGGRLPIWELQGYETDCMIGYNSVSVIADALDKGIGGVDYTRLFEAMLSSARSHKFGLDSFYSDGCVTVDAEKESVSRTLEYSYDAWCVARVGELLSDPRGEEYLTYAQQWRNILTPEGFMNGRFNGGWYTPFDPREVNNNFTEANSWQYSFFVPQDISGHIEALGGDEAYGAKLDSLFSAQEQTLGRTQADITGQIGQYAHGNEPSHHIPYLYNYCGKAWKTQEMVRRILDTLYSPEADGLCGNSDCGQIPAWYVLSSLGIYNVCPGQGQFCLTTPLWKKSAMHFEDGNTLEIKSPGSSKRYIKSVKLNDCGSTKSYLDAKEILSGGKVNIRRCARPSSFGSAAKDRPSTSMRRTLVTAPAFEVDSPAFRDSLTVTLSQTGPGTVYVSTGGEFFEYKGPFSVKESCTMRAFCEKDGVRSATAVCGVHRTEGNLSVKVLSRYSSQYSAGGDNGLVDGLRGSVNWAKGYWQGHQGTDFRAVLDLGESKKLSGIGAGFCQDVRSWIWMPKGVSFAGSQSPDGPFKPIGRVENKVSPTDYTIQVQDLVLKVPASTPAYRYIEVKAESFGTIPEWHLGAGGEAFIFIDEIFVK